MDDVDRQADPGGRRGDVLGVLRDGVLRDHQLGAVVAGVGDDLQRPGEVP